MIAALYVLENGPYFGLEDVDPWPESRDARTYAGPYPVVAHPPCSSWCQLASVNEKRWGAKIGDDGGCFAAALQAVRTWGGVLEHPAFTLAWPEYGLQRPRRKGWAQSLFDPGWTCEVWQSAYGHRARKRTWLYYVGPKPPELDWSRHEGEARVGHHVNNPLGKPTLSPREACASPPAFRSLLLSLAQAAASPAERKGANRAE